MITEGGEDVRLVHVASYADIGSGADAASGGAGGLWAGGPGASWKRVRLNRKSPAHLVHGSSSGRQPIPRIWKGLHVGWHQMEGCR